MPLPRMQKEAVFSAEVLLCCNPCAALPCLPLLLPSHAALLLQEGARAHTKTAALSHSSQQRQHARCQHGTESGIACTYVVVPLPAAPPPCRLTAGSLRRTLSPSRPCTRCCIPRACRRWLGACSHSSTPLHTPDPRRHRPCGCSTGTVRMGPLSTLCGVEAWYCPLNTLCVLHAAPWGVLGWEPQCCRGCTAVSAEIWAEEAPNQQLTECHILTRSTENASK